MATVSKEKALASAASLRAFVRDGRASRRRLGRWERDEPGAFQRHRIDETYRTEALRAGRNAGALAKARQAADEYTAKEVEALCHRVVAHRAPFAAWHFQL